MQARHKALIAIATIAIAAAFLAWRQRTPAPSAAAAPHAAATMVDARTDPAAPETLATKAAERWEPDTPDDRPFAEIRPELERRALAGDAAAARRLGIALATCNHYVELPDSKLEDIVVDGAARGFTLRDGGRVVPPDELLGRLKLGMQQKRRDCKGVSGLDEPDAWKQAFQWIERAAALGDADAEATYGTLAFADVTDRDALVDAEKMRDRKQLAIDYAQRSLGAGDALALLHLSQYYGEGGLVPSDPEMSYAYLYAYSLTARASEIVPALLENILAEHAASLDDATRERARAEGQRLAACCGIAVTP